ncbi:hypothetical protein D9M71_370900 [compost metagenome]
MPELLAGARVHGEYPRVGAGDVHHAILHQRLGLLATLLLATEGQCPHRAQLLHVVAVEGIQGAVALALQAQAIGHHLVGGFGVIEDVLVGDTGQGQAAGQRHGDAQQRPGERLVGCGELH